jgi:energy-coupling factor transporter ATP-binding protein EcfA2
MIDTITVRGFKSIVDATLELGSLNVMVGANGAGKSNVLEAIGLLGAAVAGRVAEDTLRYRGVRPGRPTLYKSAFHGSKIPRVIRLSAANGAGSYRVALDNPIDRPEPEWRFANEHVGDGRVTFASRGPAGTKFFDRRGQRLAPADPADRQGVVPLMRALRDDDPAGDVLRRLEGFAVYTPFTPMLRGLAPDPTSREPLGLNGGGLAGALRDLRVRAAASAGFVERSTLELIDWAESIHVSRSEGPTGRALYLRDRVMREGRDWLSAADASEGSLYILFLMLLLHHPHTPALCGVDNIDSALHPNLARALMDRIQQLLLDTLPDRQLIVTTHNPLVLDALQLADSRVRLFVVSRQKGSGFTTIRRIEHSDALARAQSKGRTLSQLWVEGTLGGVPDLM